MCIVQSAPVDTDALQRAARSVCGQPDVGRCRRREEAEARRGLREAHDGRQGQPHAQEPRKVHAERDGVQERGQGASGLADTNSAERLVRARGLQLHQEDKEIRCVSVRGTCDPVGAKEGAAPR